MTKTFADGPPCHTQGPWSVSTMWVKRDHQLMIPVLGPGGYVIAYVPRGIHEADRADAALIAAAPTLLAALRGAKPIIQNFYDGNEALYNDICDAIESTVVRR